MVIDNDKMLVVPYPKVTMGRKTHIFNDHPRISSKISEIRGVDSASVSFRELTQEATTLLAQQVFSHMSQVGNKKILLVPILRAGLAMEPAMKKLLPQAKVGFSGVYRHQDTFEAVPYYWEMPKDIDVVDETIVLNPMLATGESLKHTIDRLKAVGCRSIHVMSLIAAPQAIDLIQQHHPDVEMYVAHLDDGLNRYGYIVPGLGDAGDRIFGTK